MDKNDFANAQIKIDASQTKFLFQENAKNAMEALLWANSKLEERFEEFENQMVSSTNKKKMKCMLKALWFQNHPKKKNSSNVFNQNKLFNPNKQLNLNKQSNNLLY